MHYIYIYIYIYILFNEGSRKFYINFASDFGRSDLPHFVCGVWKELCREHTITSFRNRFNNHKSMNRYGKGQRGIAGEHLYAPFFEEGHRRIEDISVTKVKCPNIYLNYTIKSLYFFCVCS